jgi:hypothetical protein
MCFSLMWQRLCGVCAEFSALIESPAWVRPRQVKACPKAGRIYGWILGMSGLLPAEIAASLRSGSAWRQRYIQSNISLP